MDWIARLADLAKVQMRLISVVAIATGACLFLPSTWLDAMSLSKLKEDYGLYIGIAFVLSVARLLVECVMWCVRKLQKKRSKLATESAIKNYMLQLDTAEKALLREFYIADAKSIRLPLEQPEVASLIRNGVLFQVSAHGMRTTVGSTYAFSVTQPANELLSPAIVGVDPSLIEEDGDEWDFNEDGYVWMMKNRPQYMIELDRHVNRMQRLFG